MIMEILLCVYLPHCILEPNQCNIEESNKQCQTQNRLAQGG